MHGEHQQIDAHASLSLSPSPHNNISKKLIFSKNKKSNPIITTFLSKRPYINSEKLGKRKKQFLRLSKIENNYFPPFPALSKIEKTPPEIETTSPAFSHAFNY